MKYLIEMGLSSKKTNRMFRTLVEYDDHFNFTVDPIDRSLYDVIIDLTNRAYDPHQRGQPCSRLAVARSSLSDSTYWAYKSVPLKEYADVIAEIKNE